MFFRQLKTDRNSRAFLFYAIAALIFLIFGIINNKQFGNLGSSAIVIVIGAFAWFFKKAKVQEQKGPFPPFFIRATAALIDFFLIIVLSMGFPLMVLFLFPQQNGIASLILFPIFILSLFVYLLYFPLMESSKHQGSIGKILMEIRVTDMQKKRISFWRAFGRYVAKVICMSFIYIDIIPYFFSEKKQCIHDMLVRTIVTNI